MIAYGLLSGCAQAPLIMWVHAYHTTITVMYSKQWALISFSDICVPAWNCIGCYAITIPPLPIPSPPTLGPNVPRVLFHRPRPLGGDSPPQSWSRCGDTYDRRAAAQNLVDWVLGLTVTFSMHRRDLTPILPPTQHHCLQPPSTTHSHPPHGMSANLINCVPKIFL